MPEPRTPTPIEALLGRTEWARTLARGLVGERDADDLVQEAWLSILRGEARAASADRAWWRTLLSRRAVDLHRSSSRRRRREERAEPRSDPEPPDRALETFETHRLLVDAVERLTEPYRAAIIERYFEERPVREIARKREVPAATVRSWLGRGLAKLREDLDRSFGGKRLAGILGLCVLARGRVAEGAGAGATSATGIGLLGWGVLAMQSKLVVGAVVVALGVVAWFGFERESTRAPTTAPDRPVASTIVEASPRGPAPEAAPPIPAQLEGGSPAHAVSPLLATIRGHVRLADGGSLAGERIFLWPKREDDCPIAEDGSFAFSRDRAIRSSLFVEVGGVEISASKTIAVALGETEEIDLLLDPGSPCAIQCSARDTGLPVPGARVRLDSPDRATQARSVFGETDRAGAFEPELVPSDHYMLEVKAPGFCIYQSALEVPLEEPHAAVLDRAARLIVTIEGVERYPELRDISLEFFGGGLRSNFYERGELGAGNRVELDAPPPGWYRTRLVGRASMPETSAALVVPESAEEVLLTLTIPHAGGFLGRCVDALGVPIHPGSIGFNDGTSNYTDAVELASDGRFVRPEIRPGPTMPYLFLGTGEERCDLDLGEIFVDHASGREITFRVGGTATLQVELIGFPAADPAPELFVNLMPEEFRRAPLGSLPPDPARSTSAGIVEVPHIRATIRTKSSGAFVPHLTPGRFRATIQRKGLRLHDDILEVRPGDNTLRIPYREPATWELVVRIAEGTTPPERISIRASRGERITLENSFAVRDGRVRFDLPPDGELVVRVVTDGFEALHFSLRADPGETTEAELELVPLP